MSVLRLPAWVSRYAAARGSRHERERERALYSPHGRSGKMVAFVDERFIATRTQHLINCNVRRERKKEKRAACVERARKSESERARESERACARCKPPSGITDVAVWTPSTRAVRECPARIAARSGSRCAGRPCTKCCCKLCAQ